MKPCAVVARPNFAPLLVMCIAMSGCAISPNVPWTPPETKESPPVSLGYAYSYADSARAAYQRAIEDQVQTQANLNSGVLGLGALALGLAVGNAHKDAVLGAALLGGTAYAYGYLNFNKQRLLVYQAGIDAINCSKRVVAPLAISTDHLKALDTALQDLGQQVTATVNARSQVAQDLARWNAQTPEDGTGAAAAQASMSAAATAIDSANRTSTAAGQASTKVEQVGDKLVGAVDQIRSTVQKVAIDTLPDPSAVFKVLPSLASFAGLIVPGADTAINAALNKRRDSFAPQGKSLTNRQGQDIGSLGAQLGISIAKLNAETDKLVAQLARVNGLMPSADALAGPDGLKDCGVINVDTALKGPSTVSIPAGSKTVMFGVSGGAKPYSAQFQASPTPGLTIRSPISHDGKFTIEVTQDAKAGSYPVEVEDGSLKRLTLSVEVQGSSGDDTSAGAEGGVAKPEGKPLTGAAASVAQAITKKRQFQHAGVELTLTAPAKRVSDTEITVSFRCNPKPAQCIAAADARNTVITAVGGQAAQFRSALNISGVGCICSP